MKISKVFTGLVVCGALIFPGALSSSAKEIVPLKPTISVSYSAPMPSINHIEYFPFYNGPFVEHIERVQQAPPYAPLVYKGRLFYVKSESTFNSHKYFGSLDLVNKPY